MWKLRLRGRTRQKSDSNSHWSVMQTPAFWDVHGCLSFSLGTQPWLSSPVSRGPAPISETLSSIPSGPLEAGLASGFVASAWLQRKPHSMHVARTRRMQREIRARLGVSESHGLIPRLVFTPGVSQLRLHASPINCEISSSEPVTTLLLQEILFQVCSMCAITWGRTDIYIVHKYKNYNFLQLLINTQFSENTLF